MQEVAPAPPAQIMTSEMLLPQCCLHDSLDRRGREACCSRLGVLGAGWARERKRARERERERERERGWHVRTRVHIFVLPKIVHEFFM